MAASRLRYAVKRYEGAIAALETQASLIDAHDLAGDSDPCLLDAVLEVLAARDAVHIALVNRNYIALPGDLLRRVRELDQTLNQHHTLINQVVKLSDWRDVLNPSHENWWWKLDQAKPAPLRDRLDPLWQGLSIALLTASASLLAALSTRFFRSGPDELGLSAILISSVITLLTAGGALTRGGRHAIEHLLTSLNVDKNLWDELICLFSVFLLLVMGSFWQMLPLISQRYTTVGNDALQAERLVDAKEAYERAIQIEPDNISARLNLGKTYEKMPDIRKSAEHYEIAVRSGRLGRDDRLSTYNSLITLETRRRNFEQAETWLYECQSRMGYQLGECGTETIVRGYLINKKFVEASALLISDRDRHVQYHTFGHYPPERRYQILVYLGQALLEQKNPAPAEQALRQAMQIFENKAPAHCLLAQVFEQRQEAKQEKQAWEQCIAYGRLINAEEATWMNQARQRLAAIGD